MSRTVAMMGAIVVLLGACADDDLGIRSGDRLRLKYMVAPDGAETLVAAYDRQLEMECWFRTASDGHERCMPPIYTRPLDFFGDSECTKPVVFSNECIRYAQLEDPDTCGLRLVELGEPFPSGTQPVFKLDDNGECIEDPQPNLSAVRYLGNEVSPEIFALVEERLAPGSDRLRPRVLEGEDGSVLPIGLYDSDRDEACYSFIATDGQRRCMPWYGATFSDHRAEESCSEPLGEVDREPVCASVEEPQYVGDFGRECETYRQYQLYELGPETDEIWSGADGSMCAAGEPATGIRYHTAGAAIAPEVFAPLRWTFEPGDTRLRSMLYTTEDGTPFNRFGWWMWDTELEVQCRMAIADDGYQRCLPSHASVWQVFLDSECTQEESVAIHTRLPCDEGSPPAYAATEIWVSSCVVDGSDDEWTVYELGEPIAQVYRPDYQSGGECAPFTADEPYVYDAYRLGPKVPPETFERVVHYIE